jgi:hypothetical protein
LKNQPRKKSHHKAGGFPCCPFTSGFLPDSQETTWSNSQKTDLFITTGGRTSNPTTPIPIATSTQCCFPTGTAI